MLYRFIKAFHFSEGVVTPLPSVAITAPRGKGELREQMVMDVIADHRNLLRFAFVALVAAYWI